LLSKSTDTMLAKMGFSDKGRLIEDQSYYKIFERTLEAIIITGPDGRVIDANPAAAKMLGYNSPAEMQGNISVNAYAHPKQRDAIFKELNQHGFIENHEVELVRQDGSNIHFIARLSATIIKDNQGRFIRTEVMLTDISEQKKMESSLKECQVGLKQMEGSLLETQSYLNAIYQGTKIGLAVGDLAGHFITINPAIQQILGYNLDELKQLTIADITYPDDLSGDLLLFQEILEGKRTHYQIEKRYIHKNGSLIWCLAGVTLILDKNGRPKFAIGTIDDITERKKIEQELIKSKAEITGFAKHLEDVREKERARIASDLHDDLGQRLTALNMDLSWLISRLKFARPDIANRLISMSALLLNTIEATQAISTELRPGILDDLGLSTAIEWQLEEFSKRTGIHYRLSFPPDDLTISPELSILFFRIVQEALTNITRYARATNVNIDLRQENETLNLVINDNGCGITNSDISNPKSFGILGMRERVKSYRGDFSITGKKGKGTRIKIVIPIISKDD
jgi:PAS domain S-box-containing protein